MPQIAVELSDLSAVVDSPATSPAHAAAVEKLRTYLPKPPTTDLVLVATGGLLDNLQPLLRDNVRVELKRGHTYTWDAGLDLRFKNVTVAVTGTGANPVLKFVGKPQNAQGRDRWPAAFVLSGENVVVEDVDIDGSGSEWRATALRVTGTNCFARRCNPVDGLRFFLEVSGCNGFTAENCGNHKRLSQKLFVYTNGRNGQNARRVTLRKCVGASFEEHWGRFHGFQNVRIIDCDIDGSFKGDATKKECRSALNVRDGSDFLAENNTIAGNCGAGPLADGNGLDAAGKPKDDTVMAKRLLNTVLKGNRIRFKDNAAINVEMGADGLTVEGNEITLAGSYAVNIETDTRYAARGEPKNVKVLNNVIHGKAGWKLVKGTAANVTASGNTAEGAVV